MDRTKAVELGVRTAIARKYGTSCPARLTVRDSDVMLGWNFVVSVPGQSRTVFISLDTVVDDITAATEKASEEVLFALYCLLDEDEDEKG